MKQGNLPADFPALAQLEAGGVTTFAGARKFIDGDEAIDGIGPATEEKISAALKAADGDAGGTADTGDGAKEAAVTNVDRDGSGKSGTSASVPGKEVTDDEATRANLRSGAAEAEARADALNPAQKKAKDTSLGQMLANSRFCFYDDPSGPYVANADDVRVEGNPRIKVLPISMTTPHKGMDIRDGADSFVVTEEMDGDNPSDWLKVRSPNTGLALIR